ncbi:hypothetical protein BC567DRAFT_9871 [Phyllosticta citribraziliensis]
MACSGERRLARPAPRRQKKEGAGVRGSVQVGGRRLDRLGRDCAAYHARADFLFNRHRERRPRQHGAENAPSDSFGSQLCTAVETKERTHCWLDGWLAGSARLGSRAQPLLPNHVRRSTVTESKGIRASAQKLVLVHVEMSCSSGPRILFCRAVSIELLEIR